MNKFNKWRVIDRLQTDKKMKNMKKYLSLKLQKIRNIVKNAAKSALFIIKLTIIISKSFYYFAKVSSFLDDAKSFDNARSFDNVDQCRVFSWSKNE